MKKQKRTQETQKVDEVIQNTEGTETTNEAQTDGQETKSVEVELELAKQKCIDLSDKNLRLMAEFDNYRKRTLKERSDLIKTAAEI